MSPDPITIGVNKINLSAIGSTNDFVRDKLTKGEDIPEGTVIIAEKQEHGRGQRGNIWLSQAGKNLTFSVVLYPGFLTLPDQFELSKAISVGIVHYLRNTLTVNMAAVRIKWPNDIYIGENKIAGILIENAITGSKWNYSIVGIGLNVNQLDFDKSLPNPTSLTKLTGRRYDLVTELENLCNCLTRQYSALRNGAEGVIGPAYAEALYRYSELCDFEYRGDRINGKITNVDRSGKLIISLVNGEAVHCEFGELTFSNT